MERTRPRPLPTPQYRRQRLHVPGHGHAPPHPRARRRDPPVHTHPGPGRQRLSRQLPPHLRVGVQIDEQGRGTGRTQPQFLHDPVPGKRRVPHGRRCRTGQRQVYEPLLAVELELPGEVHGERPRRGGRGAQPGEDGLRLQRIGQLDHVRRTRAGQHLGRDGRQYGKHGGRVHEAPLAHGRGREQQHCSGHRSLPIDSHRLPVDHVHQPAP